MFDLHAKGEKNIYVWSVCWNTMVFKQHFEWKQKIQSASGMEKSLFLMRRWYMLCHGGFMILDCYLYFFCNLY